MDGARRTGTTSTISARRWVLFAGALAAAFAALGSACGVPSIKIASPVNGAFSTASTVTLTGTIANVAPASVRVTVNGSSAALNPDSTWSITLPLDAAKIENPFLALLVATSDGHTLDHDRIVVQAGSSVADGAFSPQSVALRLNDSGLDQIEPLVQSLVHLDLATLLPVGTVVISNYCAIPGPFGTCLGRENVSVANPPPTISGFSLNVDAQTGYVTGNVTVDDMRIDLNLSGSGLAPSCGLRLTASTTGILGNYGLQPLASDPHFVDVNLLAPPVVSFTGFDQEFTSGICDFPLIGSLIQLIIGSVQPLVTSGLQSYLSDPDGSGPLDSPIADAIESALAGISISGPIGDSLKVNLDAPLFAVPVDTNGLTLASDLRVTSSVGTGPGQCQPPAGAPDLTASYSVDEPFPSFGTTTPVGGVPYDLALSVSTSAFNQLLKAQVECGLLRMDISEIDLGGGPMPLTAGTLALIIPELTAFDPAMPVVIRLAPTLAPLLTGNAGPGGELGELRVGQLVADVTGQDGPNHEFLMLRVAVDFRAGLDMSFADGSLSFSIGSVAPADITVGILENAVHTNENVLGVALPFVLAEALPSLGAGLAAFPIPSFFGLELQGLEVSRNGQFYSLFANLRPAP